MWLYAVLTLSGMLSLGLACPTHECLCFQDTEIDCTDMYFKGVPEWFPENTTYFLLDLSKNRIKTFSAWAFKGIQVRKLVIRDNKNDLVLHPDAFRGLEDYLRVLTLKDSRLLALPTGLFKGMSKLRNIDLSQNGRCGGGGGRCQGEGLTIVPETFRGARNVLELNLMQNSLTKISARSFVGLKSLKKLNLNKNELDQVDSLAFKGLPALEDLALDHNNLRDLQPKTFKKLPSLRQLKLHHNNLHALFPLMFKGMHKLEYLSLFHNEIFMVADDTFKSLSSCTKLILSDNKLATLKPGMFNGMEKLNMLDLNQNQITDLPDKLFHSNPELSILHLDSNGLGSLNPCAFRDVRKVKDINIWRNNITCNCALKWISDPSIPTIVRGQCASPPDEKGKDVGNPNRYTVCTFTGMECENDQVPNDASFNTPLRYWLRYRRAYQQAPYLFYGKKKK